MGHQSPHEKKPAAHEAKDQSAQIIDPCSEKSLVPDFSAASSDLRVRKKFYSSLPSHFETNQ